MTSQACRAAEFILESQNQLWAPQPNAVQKIDSSLVVVTTINTIVRVLRGIKTTTEYRVGREQAQLHRTMLK